MSTKKTRKKLNIIHPIFRIKGGAEKVIVDLSLWASSLYDVEVFTFFNDDYLKKLSKYTFISESADKLFLSNLLGFKANPFINSLIKKLGNLPRELYSGKYHAAAFLLNYWKKHDREIVQNSNIITLSRFVNEQVETIYDKKAVKAFEHYTYLFDQKTKEEGLKNINQKFNLDIQKNELVFLSLGRLEHGKGIEQLIEIFKELLGDKSVKDESVKQLRLIIGGRGSLSKKVTELIKNQ